MLVATRVVRHRDILTDDLGVRFAIISSPTEFDGLILIWFMHQAY